MQDGQVVRGPESQMEPATYSTTSEMLLHRSSRGSEKVEEFRDRRSARWRSLPSIGAGDGWCGSVFRSEVQPLKLSGFSARGFGPALDLCLGNQLWFLQENAVDRPLEKPYAGPWGLSRAASGRFPARTKWSKRPARAPSRR